MKTKKEVDTKREVDYLKFQRKVNTLLGMPFYVDSTDKLGITLGKFVTTSYQIFTEIIVIVLAIGQFWAIPYVSEDMNVLCGCLASCAHCTQLVAKTFFLNVYKNRYTSHLEKVHEVQKGINAFECSVNGEKSSGFEAFYLKQSRYVNVIVSIQLAVNVASTSAYFLPFVYDSLVHSDQVERQLTPIVVYVGTDFNYTPLFQIIIFVLTIGFYVVNLKTVVIDNFLLSLIVLHMSQFRYHNNLLKEIIKSQMDASNKNLLHETVIRNWVKHHQALLSLSENFRRLVSPYLFLEFSYVLIHTCVPAFVITSTFSWTLPQKVAVFLILGGGLIELFLMSNAGDVFTDARDSTGDILFRSEFVFKDEKWMKHVFFMIQKRLQRTFRLVALNIVPLNCATFALILRLIFSYYMTLNQLQKIKRND